MSHLLPVFLLSSLSSCSCFMDFTCLSDMNPSPGVSLPRGDTSVQVGSSPVTLTCHLNPDHPEYLSGVRATDLAFQSNLTILKSTVLNETSISSMFIPLVEGVTDISCIILSDNTVYRPLNIGICTQRMLVGHPPRDISSFSCVSSNWESLNCTWSEPPNPVPTKYETHFTTPGTWAGFKQCPGRGKIETMLQQTFPPSLRMCFVNLRTIPQYRHVTKRYVFFFNATNSLAPGGTVYRHTVDHFSVVRPGPATVRVESMASDMVRVEWNITKEMTHFPPGLVQMVRYKSEWVPDMWREVDTTHLNSSQESFSVMLPGQLLPYTLYTVEVTMMTNLPTTPPSLHSPPVLSTIRTQPAPPPRPPTTTLASFEVVESGDTCTVTVYWQSLHPWEQSGPEFTYTVSRLGGHKHTLPHKLTQSYAQFTSLPSDQSYSFSIASSNSAGTSSSVATVSVPPPSTTTSLLPRSVTKIYEEDDIFTLSWLPPSSSALVTSYTLFWCLSTSGQDRPYQCEGYLDWKTITTEQLNGSLSHSLVLPMTTSPAPVFQLAVAANTATLSSGLQWTTCTVKSDRGVTTKVSDVMVDTVSARSLVVRWRLHCSMRTGLVTGFAVDFCRLDQETGSCLAGSAGSREAGAGETSLEIGELTPFSLYQVTISVQNGVSPLPGHTPHIVSGPPSHPVTTKTLPATPGSPPAKVAVSQVSSRQARVSWHQPDQPNGEICKYLVQVRNLDRDQWLERRTVQPSKTEETGIVWPNLTSYTRYQVSVAACTLSPARVCDLCSKAAAKEVFTTPVGTPGQATSPVVRLLNSSVVEVEWGTEFQLGAPVVRRWHLSVRRGEQDSAVVSSTVTRLRLDLRKVMAESGWGPGCSNNSVYLEYYSFSVRAEVVNSEGEVFTGPWSEQTVQPVSCTPVLPWAMLVLVLGTTLVVVLAVCACVYCSCSWFREKKDMIKKIGGELDSREIAVVPPPEEMFEYELQPHQEYVEPDLEEGQYTVLLRTHKNSSSSTDSGVSSQPPASPPGYSREDSGVSGMSGVSEQEREMPGYTGQDRGVSAFTRQTSSIPSVGSVGYISMGESSAPQSPVSGPGYSVVGHVEPASQDYVPFTAIRQVKKQNHPGYISLGLVLQPDLVSGAYSRVEARASMPGVTRLEEEKYKAPEPDLSESDTRKLRLPRDSLETVVMSSTAELSKCPHPRDITYV